VLISIVLNHAHRHEHDMEWVYGAHSVRAALRSAAAARSEALARMAPAASSLSLPPTNPISLSLEEGDEDEGFSGHAHPSGYPRPFRRDLRRVVLPASAAEEEARSEGEDVVIKPGKGQRNSLGAVHAEVAALARAAGIPVEYARPVHLNLGLEGGEDGEDREEELDSSSLDVRRQRRNPGQRFRAARAQRGASASSSSAEAWRNLRLGIPSAGFSRRQRQQMLEKSYSAPSGDGLARAGPPRHHPEAVTQSCFLEASPLVVPEVSGLRAPGTASGRITDAAGMPDVDIDSISLLAAVPQRKRLWVAVERIQDVVNFGGILRVCAYFGVPVVFQPRYNAPCSAATSRASTGAMEHMPLYATHNLTTFLENSRRSEWDIVGTELAEDITVTPEELIESHPDRPTILVLGSEGTGLRAKTVKTCSSLVRIPGDANLGEQLTGSLNVQVACGILVQQFLR
jgi:tRNA G18 (ribose-2'-O)-methylase SpoU